MSSQLDQSFGSYANANAAVIPAFTAVKITASGIDLPTNGGTDFFGVTQEDGAIGATTVSVKLLSGDGTFMMIQAVATVAGTAYSLDASGQVVAVAASPRDVARVRAVRTNATASSVNEFILL